MVIELQPDEEIWSEAIKEGRKMPFADGSLFIIITEQNVESNPTFINKQ